LSFIYLLHLRNECSCNPAIANFIHRFASVLRFSVGKIVDATNLPFATNTLRNIPLRRDETATIKAYYISLYTRDANYKFYPFYESDMNKLMEIVSSATGLTSFKEGQYVRYTVAKRLTITRNHVLTALIKTRARPWIDHSAELIRVLRRLTQEHEPQAIYDLERLYHSCRLESEVTKETLTHMRVLWHNSPSETVRLKILTIVERILDRSIMREGDPNFIILYKWLGHLEETVSPYKR
jgi:hypothetical protein